MTKTATDFASKLAVAFVAVAMVVAAFAPAAQAQSSEDLQQMINDLLAQVALLQGGTTGGGSAMTCDSFSMSLSQGDSNGEVMKLQQFLNQDADTRVSAMGAGSMGMETMYYGPATAAAVSKFQVKYRADILAPVSLVNPTGFFGPSSIAKANALCAAVVVVVEEEEAEAEEGAEEEEEESEVSLSGSANLDAFEIDDASDEDVEEGDEDVEIGVFTVEFDNGDAEVTRMDIALLGDGDNDGTVDANTDDAEPWETFESISLFIDGDKVAEVDADNEDDYLDEDLGELRFSDLGLIAMEGEEIEITVGATLQSGIDAEELGDWELYATGMRFFDADGVATTEDNFEDIDETPNTGTNDASFTVEEAGEGDEFDVRTSSEDPAATTLPLEDDEKTEYVSFAFEFDASDSDSDVEVNEFTLGVSPLENDGTTATSALLIVDDVKVIVDGSEVDTDDVTVTATTIVVEFDNEFYVDAGEEVTVEIEVEYKSLTVALEGATVQFSIAGSNVDAEGADDITVGGAATGDEHTLRSEGVILKMTDEAFSLKVNSDATAADDEGNFTLKYEVTAFEDDFFFNKTSASTTASTTQGAEFQIETGGVAVVFGGGAGTTTSSLTSTADTEGLRFVVREGETETFTLKVNFDPATSDFYALQLANVNYYTVSAGVTGQAAQSAIPAENFETDEYSI